MTQPQQNAIGELSATLNDKLRVEELSDTDSDEAYMIRTDTRVPSSTYRPAWLQTPPITRQESLVTETSNAQQKTEAVCMPYLLLEESEGLRRNSFGLPHLSRDTHIHCLHNVFKRMPAPYMVMDASRPWLFYWALQGLTILGEDVSHYKQRLIGTLRPLQNGTGGFAGGFGQNSHCATTYGCILALTMVDGLEMVNRESMWRFLGQVKQADGGFRVAIMAEEDIRGAYCAMTIITLLNLPLKLPDDAPARQHGLTSFLDGLGEWIGRCQTYEGGIAGAPNNEAHGAYAFCALACLSIIDSPARSIPKYLDVPALLRWMADIQTSPEGGFAGRTNKLVDACYSHWVGSSWALIEAASPSQHLAWNREGLVRYLLTCCQDGGKKGGMRDKPSARPDAYHTCYSLAGLSAATHHYTYTGTATNEHSQAPLQAPFSWSYQDASEQELVEWKVEKEDVPNAVHPVFVVPFDAVAKARQRFGHASLSET